jgi:hypothetical protein
MICLGRRRVYVTISTLWDGEVAGRDGLSQNRNPRACVFSRQKELAAGKGQPISIPE